jgi:nitrogen fixation protein FixH
MKKPRINKNLLLGQSLIEFSVLFAIVVAASLTLFGMAPSIFSGYVASATGAMQ